MSRTWSILGAVLLVAVGLVLAVTFFGPRVAAPEPTQVPPTETAAVSPLESPLPEPDPDTGELAASVDGSPITQEYLSKTVRLNRVLGALSGASVLGERETLERLVRSQVILNGAPPGDGPTDDEVEGFISSLQRNWGVSDATVVARLEAEGLERGFLEETIKRLLTVQAAVDGLETEGHNLSEWLRAQQQEADIWMIEDPAEADKTELGGAEESTDLSPPEETTAATEPPASGPEVPTVAPAFTLEQAGGGSFALEERLSEGPVVLVFFERCA